MTSMRRRDVLRLAGATLGTAALGSTDVFARGGSQRVGAPPNESNPRDRQHNSLRADYRDLRRHFSFEYYPWYGVNPWVHWEQWDRVPPLDLASSYMPRLGAYDSRSTAAIEQHAQWIADSGVGAINISWWGRDSFEDKAVPVVMDVMRAHDIHVTFHIEPYNDLRAANYASDIQYLITQYGDRRHWDCMLLLQHADRASGPVFKSFFTLMLPQQTDCHGVTTSNPNYFPDDQWHRQTDRVREMFRHDFDRITLLSDSIDMGRTVAGGFDGNAQYSNYIRPDSWRAIAEDSTKRDLLFSFQINSGFDSIARRRLEPGDCYTAPPFEPPTGPYDFALAAERERARAAGESRIVDSFTTTMALQRDPLSSNMKRGFFLVYIVSFNEWHEGTMFEPMKNFEELTAAERALRYHNPADGSYRLTLLKRLLRDVLD